MPHCCSKKSITTCQKMKMQSQSSRNKYKNLFMLFCILIIISRCLTGYVLTIFSDKTTEIYIYIFTLSTALYPGGIQSELQSNKIPSTLGGFDFHFPCKASTYWQRTCNVLLFGLIAGGREKQHPYFSYLFSKTGVEKPRGIKCPFHFTCSAMPSFPLHGSWVTEVPVICDPPQIKFSK